MNHVAESRPPIAQSSGAATRESPLRRQVGRLERRIARLERIGERFVKIRLTLFLFGAAVSTACFVWGASAPGWISLALFAVAFASVSLLHGRVKAAHRRHRLWRGIKLRHVARIRLDWNNLPAQPAVRASADHPFDLDLDVTGPESLHRLLDASLSEGGCQKLAEWLLQVRPDIDTIRDRQGLVVELTPLFLFRDKLALLAELSPGWEGGKLSESALLRWLAGETRSRPLLGDLAAACALILANAGLFAFWLYGAAPYFLLTTLAVAAFLLSRQGAVQKLFGDGLRLERSLDQHDRVFRHLETFNYDEHPRLRELCRPLWEAGSRPSGRLRKVARLVSALSVRAYFPAWIAINLFAPWDFFFAWRLHKQKEALSGLLPSWLDVWFECEAANSLANFAWLHPGYAMPRLEPSLEGLTARALGHPLIHDQARVCNNFSLLGSGKTVIVTGSNMAGKSTFLRTVGVNVCLAQAGGPVCAEEFSWSPLRLRSCIRISDSLSDGFSYFYAEVRRLKLILDQLEVEDPVPVLFLIDEIFKGTNNRERLIGSRSYIRALASRKGLGLISTHDLELAKLSEEIASLENRHFREEVVAGKMKFDYRLRPGPCPTTNALKIMRIEGLPVD